MTLRMRFDEVGPSVASRPRGTVDIDADRAAVERFQAGDTAAFDLLYRQYYRRLRAFCQRRVGDAHDAEEIAQEAFAKAFAALPTFAGERRFYPWVTVIASRLCVDHHRRSGRTEPTAELDEGAVDGGQERVLIDLDTALIRRAMGRLPDRHRDILRLREEEGWSYNRIADHYGISLGAVESLLLRARRRLRQEFVTLSGGERSLAGLPAVGLLWRRLQVAARKATGHALPMELGGIAAHAVAAAAVAAGFLLPGAAGEGGDPPRQTHAGAPAAAVEHATTVVAGDLGAPPVAPGAGEGDETSSGSGAAPTAGVAVQAPTVHSDADARGRVEERAEITPVAWVGASPEEIENDIQQDLKAVDAWVQEKGDGQCAAC